MRSGRYKLAEHVLSANVSGESVLMDYQSGKYFGLTGSVVAVVDALREGSDFSGLRDLMVRHVDVDPARAEADLRAVLGSMVDAGLVEFIEQATTS